MMGATWARMEGCVKSIVSCIALTATVTVTHGHCSSMYAASFCSAIKMQAAHRQPRPGRDEMTGGAGLGGMVVLIVVKKRGGLTGEDKRAR